MPDHVHLVMTLPHAFNDGARSLAAVMKSIKGVSARRINELLGRNDHVWQIESYDHVVRRSEGVRAVCDYALQNPVRAGLVKHVDDYPWLWRS
jgi:putative transposase